ncbi:MAG: phosphoribosylglycinamide formyltransferase, partial [Chromatocurvus sp.]
FDRAMLSGLAPHKPDLVVLAGFMRILTPAFIAAFRGRLLNIHPSLLPKYPGLDTHARALAAGDREHGATVHFVTEQLDGGPAVLQSAVSIAGNDTAETLARRILEVEHRIYPLAIAWWAAGRLRLISGEVRLDEKCIPANGIPYTDGVA